MVDTRLAALPEAERAEIEQLLREQRTSSRFVSDEGDTMAWYLLLWIAAVIGVVGKRYACDTGQCSP